MSWNQYISRIIDVCEVIAGQSPEGKYYNKDGNGLPFYQGKKEFTKREIGKPTTWTNKVTKEAIAGDILMSVRAPVGPVNFCTQKICIGRGLAAIRASEKANKDYLFYYLLKYEAEIVGNTGAVFNSINKTQIGNIPIPIPPLREQHQIVVILDQAFAAIDQTKANIEKNIENAKELFQSKLNEIFSQKGDGWEEKKLKDIIAKIGSGATPRGGQASYKESGISLIRSMNVYDIGFKKRKLAFIDEEQAGKLNNVNIEKDDILLNITGASVARCCIVPENVLPARVNQHVSIIRPVKDVILSKYLHYSLIAVHNKKVLLGIGDQGATRQAITKSQLENFIVNYPSSIKQQLKVVKDIDILKNEIRSFTTVFERKIENLEELKKSILQKAFSGALTKETLEN